MTEPNEASLQPRPQMFDMKELYEVAFKEGQRILDQQVDDLKDLRVRATMYMSFVGSATAFLAGTGLKLPERSVPFYVVAGVASFASLFTLIWLARLVLPSRANSFVFALSPKILVEDWIEADVPPARPAQMVRALAVETDEMRMLNERILAKVRGDYSRVVICGGLSLILWATLAWLGG